MSNLPLGYIGQRGIASSFSGWSNPSWSIDPWRADHLRVLGLLKRAANTCRYYLTRTGRLAIERLTTFAIVPL
ncbi:MAG: hypothetical protein JF606_02855 [Burkholderiales bacterium]|nr:hypothetical protein [Burkholderiales bacterium]